MKIALVVPNGEKNMSGMGNVARPPLGVCFLKSYLLKEGFPDVKVFHQIDETNDELVKKILEFSPVLVGFSVMSCVFSNAASLAKALKNTRPAIKIVFGGEHITGIYVDETKYGSRLMTKTLRENQCIDFLIPFEGEVVLTGLAKNIRDGHSMRRVHGTVFQNSIVIYITKKIKRVKYLDALPMADRSDLPYEKYHSVDEASNLEYMHTTRGCKFRCSYCATPVSNPGNVAKNSAGRILEEVKFLHDSYKRKSFFFCDELFTADIQRMEDFCKGLIRTGLNKKITWRVFARVDDVSNEKLNLKLMKEAGLNGLFFGVESMNLKTLRKLGKGVKPDQIRGAIEKTYRSGIDVWCSLMIGYPWETEGELKKSLSEYLTIKNGGFIKHTYVAFVTPFPGTRFYRQCVDNNWIIDKTFLQSDCSYPVLSTPIKKEVLIKIYKDFLEQV